MILLIEKLFSLILLGVLFTSLAHLLSGDKGVLRQMERANEELQTSTRLFSIVEHVYSHIDEHRYPLLPIVHRNGNLRYKEGSFHELTERHDRLAVSRESDAITTIELLDTHPLQVSNTLPLCTETAKQYQAIGYGGDILFEATIAWQEGCSPIITELPLKSMAFIQPPAPLVGDSLKAHSFLLLRSITTLYVSTESILRFVQHIGDTVIENQPLLNGAPQLLLEDRLTSLGLHELSVTASFSETDKQYSHPLTATLSRKTFDELFLHVQRLHLELP
jgi:hypothetical protein